VRSDARLAFAAAAVFLMTGAAEPVPAPEPAATPAAVAAPDLASCAAIADAAARLACYDGLAGRPADVPSALATADFGIPRSKTAPEEAPGLTAHIVGPFAEWRKGTVVRLDNGQVWKVTGDSRVYDAGVPENAEVTITHSFSGAYWMEIHAIKRKVKVKRLS